MSQNYQLMMVREMKIYGKGSNFLLLIGFWVSSMAHADESGFMAPSTTNNLSGSTNSASSAAFNGKKTNFVKDGTLKLNELDKRLKKLDGESSYSDSANIDVGETITSSIENISKFLGNALNETQMVTDDAGTRSEELTLEDTLNTSISTNSAVTSAQASANQAITLSGEAKSDANAAQSSANNAINVANNALDKAHDVSPGNAVVWQTGTYRNGNHDFTVISFNTSRNGQMRFCYNTADVNHKTHDSAVWVYRNGEAVYYKRAANQHSGCGDITIAIGDNIRIREWGWRSNWSSYYIKTSNGRSPM